MDVVTGSSLGRIAALLTVLGTMSSPSYGGDPLGVRAALMTLHPQWPSAQLSIDALGLSADGEATLAQDLRIEHEAALPGYVALIRVSSHGDMTLFRFSNEPAESGSEQHIVIQAPLGEEQVLMLYSGQPLDDLFRGRGHFRQLGSDGASADAFVREVEALKSRGTNIVSRRVNYFVVAQRDGTQYLTRSVIHNVVESVDLKRANRGGATVPSRIEFEQNSDQLTESVKLDLDLFGQALVSDLRGRRIALEGHADEAGTSDLNKNLSLRRAAVVKEYLTTSFGIPVGQMSTSGQGKPRMAASAREEDRSRNRRVDIILLAKNGP